jgi:FKBP-type peptidyl-prolyl cis-trans isomerase
LKIRSNSLLAKRTRVPHRLFILASLIALTSCDSSKLAIPEIVSTTFAPALNVDVATMTKTASGLYYRDSIVGAGTAASSRDSVVVNYIGWLTSGAQFDNSVQRGSPISFNLGRGQVITGWDEGIVNMRVGGWRKLVIPPSLGYGDQAAGPIPPNSILVFNVQLVSVIK